ncbi:MAG TPA: DNA alkylation repair protein [Candidatus Woesebacteria bacterium]|nr:DNA alkylation repair protein [Candidatus Woesebacteria bacterium]
MIKIAEEVRKELVKNADKKAAETGQRFFKEKVKLYGVKSKTCGEIAKRAIKQISGLSKKEVFENCEELYKSGYCEEGWIAPNLAYEKREEFEEKDVDVFEKWIVNYVDDWAKCDTLCNHTVATLIDKFPKLIEVLKRWTESPKRFVKRAAAVTLIIPAREGRYLRDIFEIADKLLMDPDDLVQKGYGWMLKAASQSHQKEVFDYVIKNKAIMPRTALRYAIEKLPVEMKKKCMER